MNENSPQSAPDFERLRVALSLAWPRRPTLIRELPQENAFEIVFALKCPDCGVVEISAGMQCGPSVRTIIHATRGIARLSHPKYKP